MLVVGFVMATAQQMAQAQSYEKRIGKTLDGYEREYYGLLPRVDKFESAAISTDTGGNITFLATSTEGKTSKLVYDKRFKQVFDYYILNYEAIGRQALDFNAKDLQTGQIKFPIEAREKIGRKVKIISTHKKEIIGELAFITDKNVGIWHCEETEGFDVNRLECLKMYRIDTLETMRYVKRLPLKWTGFTAGFVIGLGFSAGGISVLDVPIGNGTSDASVASTTVVSALTNGLLLGAGGFAIGSILDVVIPNGQVFRFDDMYKPYPKTIMLNRLSRSKMFPYLLPPEVSILVYPKE